jgi:hypothetical protein
MFHKRFKFLAIALLSGCLFMLAPLAIQTASAHVSETTPSQSGIGIRVNKTLCADLTCDGLSPKTTQCNQDGILEKQAASPDLGNGLIGKINLYYSPACAAAWAFIHFNRTLPAGTSANALIVRIQPDKKQYSCSDAGGSGKVLPGHEECNSPMVGDAGTKLAYAIGTYTAKNGKVTTWHTDPF